LMFFGSGRMFLAESWLCYVVGAFSNSNLMFFGSGRMFLAESWLCYVVGAFSNIMLAMLHW
jgi:hypothetical protein